MATPHNKANKEDISNIVLMSGDPLRAKYIAEKYLNDYKLVNDIRGMYAYTGYYKGKRITVMGHGMGMASIGIYAYELFKFYDVDIIIRMGSCGSYDPLIDVGDTVLATKVNTLSNIALQILNEDIKELPIYEDINNIISNVASKNNINLKKEVVTTTDVFDVYFENIGKDQSIKITEMEAFGLFAIAKLTNKKCACILTVVDNTITKKTISSTDREKNLNDMILLALESSLLL